MLRVALVGADGAGKTAVAKSVVTEAPWPAAYLYMGENPDAAASTTLLARMVWARRRRRGRGATGGPPPVERPLRAETFIARLRGKAEAATQLAVLLSEELARQRRARRHARAGTVVVCDRDFFADYRVHDVVGEGRSPAQRVHGFVLRHLYRRPDMTIVLDASVDVLYARKPEGTRAALEARRREYLDLATQDPSIVVVDVDRPFAAVVSDVLTAVAGRVGPHPAAPR